VEVIEKKLENVDKVKKSVIKIMEILKNNPVNKRRR
jgi:hypothetical protein